MTIYLLLKKIWSIRRKKVLRDSKNIIMGMIIKSPVVLGVMMCLLSKTSNPATAVTKPTPNGIR